MRITRTSKKTEKLENLEVGMVFTLPNQPETVYMVINEHDYYIDNKKIEEDEVVFIDLEYGEILTLDCETEVITINGSFVVSEN